MKQAGHVQKKMSYDDQISGACINEMEGSMKHVLQQSDNDASPSSPSYMDILHGHISHLCVFIRILGACGRRASTYF